MTYIVDGRAMSVYCQQNKKNGNTYWLARTQEEGKTFLKYFGKQDPRPMLQRVGPDLPHLHPRKNTVYLLYEGTVMTLHKNYSFCKTKNCSCRVKQVKHGPYYHGHYKGEDGKTKAHYFGTIYPTSFVLKPEEV